MFKINFLIPTLNKQSHTGDTGQSPSLRFGPGAINSSPQKKINKLQNVIQDLGQILWHDQVTEHCCTRIREVYVRLATGSTKLIQIITFSVGMEMKIIN